MRRVLAYPLLGSLVAIATAAPGCGGSDSTGGSPTTSGAGGTGTGTGSGGTGTGGAGTGGSVTTTPTKTGDAGKGGAGSDGGKGGQGQGGQGGAPCSQGTIVCDGTTKKVCDGKGGFTGVSNCALQGGLTCVPGYGCAVCGPGTGSCAGNDGTYCKDDGSAWLTETCDPVQGMACDANTGRCTGACSPKALGTSYIGCEYFPTVTANLTDSNVFHFAVAVSNTTGTDADVTVTRGANQVVAQKVAANSVQVIILPWVPELKGPSSLFVQPMPSSLLLAQGGYRLRSTQPVTVYQFNPLEYTLNGQFSYTNDASLLLPSNAWTGTYRVVARHHFYATSGFYAVTAAEDGTTVNITAGPASVLKGGVAGLDGAGNGTITMNSGDVLQMVTDGANDPSSPNDPTGTLVKADKPVQVIGGHQCTYIPDGVAACDHIEESMFPFETLSNEYIVTPPLIPTQPAPKVEVVRIVATTDNTALTYDPPQPGAPAAIATAGQWVEIANTTASFAVTGSQPILVAQYMEGEEAGGGSGDPAMALAVAKDQFRDNYLFHAPTNYESSYCNIMAPTGVDVQVDGASIGGFQPIGNTGYSVSFVTLSNAGDGNHNAKASKPFGLTVYGYGQYTSYWYAGGSNLQKLHQ